MSGIRQRLTFAPERKIRERVIVIDDSIRRGAPKARSARRLFRK